MAEALVTRDARTRQFSSFDEKLERWRRTLAKPSRILEVRVTNLVYPITEEVLSLVFSPYGCVEKIEILEKVSEVQAQIHFQSLFSAVQAMFSIYGRNIYDDCCHMDIPYQNIDSVNSLVNDEAEREFNCFDSNVKRSDKDGHSSKENDQVQEDGVSLGFDSVLEDESLDFPVSEINESQENQLIMAPVENTSSVEDHMSVMVGLSCSEQKQDVVEVFGVAAESFASVKVQFLEAEFATIGICAVYVVENEWALLLNLSTANGYSFGHLKWKYRVVDEGHRLIILVGQFVFDRGRGCGKDAIQLSEVMEKQSVQPDIEVIAAVFVASLLDKKKMMYLDYWKFLVEGSEQLVMGFPDHSLMGGWKNGSTENEKVMDLTVIMLSTNGDTTFVMIGINHGACDELLEFVQIHELQNIRQHIVKQKEFDSKGRNNCSTQDISYIVCGVAWQNTSAAIRVFLFEEEGLKDGDGKGQRDSNKFWILQN